MTLDELLAMPPTLTAKETAAAFGISEWTLLEQARAGTCVVQPLTLGNRRRVWPTAQVVAAVGADQLSNGHDGTKRGLDPVVATALAGLAQQARALGESATEMLALLGLEAGNGKGPAK